VLQLVDDIKHYLEGHDYFITAQKEIEFDKLFRRFIVKDWINYESNCRKYALQNEVVIAEYVRFYSKCWEDRNRIFYHKAKQSELLRNQCEEVQSH